MCVCRSLYEVWADGKTYVDIVRKLGELSPSLTVSCFLISHLYFCIFSQQNPNSKCEMHLLLMSSVYILLNLTCLYDIRFVSFGFNFTFSNFCFVCNC